jgi:hypothetical protein
MQAARPICGAGQVKGPQIQNLQGRRFQEVNKHGNKEKGKKSGHKEKEVTAALRSRSGRGLKGPPAVEALFTALVL